ncbi:MAG TPA: sigma-70 family RNA polymerase sigma factor [Candidatus Sumerlaeota bacterium]|nr:sigma-70 family RNA polymerase sigma factor [Candidatus Sumerlaeota bacterium]
MISIASESMDEPAPDPASAAEKEWVIRAMAGDKDAFGRLFDLYNKRLAHYLRRLIAQPEDIHDVLQDVWLAAYLKLPRLRKPEAFRSWIFTLARNRALDLRKVNRREWNLTEEDLEELEETPQRGDLPHAELEILRLAMEKLKPKHREVIFLFFFEAMPIKEIAGVVGCDDGTVKSRIHYAKQHLKKAIMRLSQ